MGKIHVIFIEVCMKKDPFDYLKREVTPLKMCTKRIILESSQKCANGISLIYMYFSSVQNYNIVTTCNDFRFAIKLSSDFLRGSNIYKLSENYIQIICPFLLLLLERVPFCLL
jgi:hypothetical protein